MMADKGEFIIRRYFEAYRKKERDILEELLLPDFTFTSPRDDAIDRATYFDWCWKSSGHIVGHDLERIVQIGENEFLIVYLCTADGGRQFRNAEVFTLTDDKVRAVEVYFGPGFKDGLFVATE